MASPVQVCLGWLAADLEHLRWWSEDLSLYFEAKKLIVWGLGVVLCLQTCGSHEEDEGL